MKTIAVDFDGTLIFNKYPALENPNMDLINFILKYRKHYIWVLWTCRSGQMLQEAVDYMKSFGIEFDYVNENRPDAIEEWNNDCRKVWADYYIDDKNISLKQLKNKRIMEWIKNLTSSCRRSNRRDI